MCIILHDLSLCGHETEIKIPGDTVLEQQAISSRCHESRLEDFSEGKCVQCRQDAEDKAESWRDALACSEISEELASIGLGEEPSSALTLEESIVHNEDRKKKKTWKMKAKKKRKVGWIMQEIEEKETKKNGEEGRKGKKEEIQENHDTSDPPADARSIQSTIERTSPPVLSNQHAVKHMLL